MYSQQPNKVNQRRKSVCPIIELQSASKSIPAKKVLTSPEVSAEEPSSPMVKLTVRTEIEAISH